MTNINIRMTSSLAKTFAGGGSTYSALIQDGAGNLTITGSNTFDTISNSVQPVLFIFTVGTTQTVNNFNIAGISGSLVTLNSSSPGTPGTGFSFSKSSGVVNGNYLSLRDSTATGGATWYAANSTNTSNNGGWIFTRVHFVTLSDLSMDATDGGFTISNSPIP